jgi:hypothetical protein
MVIAVGVLSSVGWVKLLYEVLLFVVYAIFGTVICVSFYLLTYLITQVSKKTHIALPLVFASCYVYEIRVRDFRLRSIYVTFHIFT